MSKKDYYAFGKLLTLHYHSFVNDTEFWKFVSEMAEIFRKDSRWFDPAKFEAYVHEQLNEGKE